MRFFDIFCHPSPPKKKTVSKRKNKKRKSQTRRVRRARRNRKSSQ